MPSQGPGGSGSLLPRWQAQRIFDKQIAPTLLGPHIQARPDPRLILLGAQPGAGKTSLANIIGESLGPERRPVVLDFDALRPFYPGYQKIKARMGPAGDRLVADDVYRWLTMAFDYVRAHRCDVIVEHTMPSTESVDDVVNRFASTPPGARTPPYRIAVTFLATPAAESRLGMLERYQLACERVGYGRHPGDQLHDHRYRSVLEVADWVDADSRVGEVAVYRRGISQALHRNQRDAAGAWISDVPTRQIVAGERARRWDLPRSQRWLSTHASLTTRMDPRWSPSLEMAWHDALPLLDPAALATVAPDPEQQVARMWETALQATHPETRRHDNQAPAPCTEDPTDPGLIGPDATGAEGAGL